MVSLVQSKGIAEIQYLRALAVLMVVAGHIHQAESRFFGDALFSDAAYFGFAGVDLFFVISGFIIHYLYGNRPRPSARYFLKRINRIYPIYWIFTALALLGYVTIGDSLTRETGELDILASLTLIPTGQPPILMVGWTLTHELYFYLAYGLFLALPGRYRVWAAAAWAGAAVLFALVFYEAQSPWLHLVFSPFNLQFLAGVLLAHVYGGLRRTRWLALVPAAAGVALALWWMHGHGLDGMEDLRLRVALFSPFAIGTVWAALAWAPRLPAFAARIGDWSYSIYLGHLLAIGVLARLLPRYIDGSFWASPAFWSVSLTACLAFGALSHYALELPLLRTGKAAIARLAPGPARRTAGPPEGSRES